MERETTVRLDDASKGFDALCTHFREDHDFEVTVADDRADIVFPGGACAMTASPKTLHLRFFVDDSGALPMVESFFTSHLQRMALKSRQPVDWCEPLVGGTARAGMAASKLQGLAAVLDQAARSAGQG